VKTKVQLTVLSDFLQFLKDNVSERVQQKSSYIIHTKRKGVMEHQMGNPFQTYNVLRKRNDSGGEMRRSLIKRQGRPSSNSAHRQGSRSLHNN
jgi:hypothetical protein